MKPCRIQTKTNRNLSTGWAQRDRGVTSLKSTVGTWHHADGLEFLCLTSISLTPSVRSPNLPHQTPALMIDGTVENWKPFISVSLLTFTNNRAEEHLSHRATSFSHCWRRFSPLLLIPVLMMIITWSNHDLNYNPTAAWGQGAVTKKAVIKTNF